MKQLLIEKLTAAVKSLYDLDVTPQVDYTNDLSFGDLTTNVAMTLAKQAKKAPALIAQEIVAYLQHDKDITTKFSDINAVNGFINLTVASDILLENIYNMKEGYGNNKSEKPQRMLVEYGDPNSHKLPHIGHLFSYIVGESIARIQGANGHSIYKATYQGDVGLHVAKALYGYIQLGQPKPSDPTERVQLLQRCYQEGCKAYDEDPIAKETIIDINTKIYNKDPEIFDIWKETRQWSVDYYLQFEHRLGINIHYHYWESEIAERGKSKVLEKTGTVFEKSDGAIVFKGEPYGLHTRVFINKQGNPTYEAKDMGLNIVKYEDWPYDLNVILTASEQDAYFDVVFKALELCYPELKGKLKHIGHGMISLTTGKMSSRTGQVVSGVDLLDTVKAEVLKIVAARKEIPADKVDEIAERVTVGAVKFAFLKQNALLDSKFDWKEATSFEGKTGPYIQYTFARIQSVLKQKADIAHATTEDTKNLTMPEEKLLERWLMRFPDVVFEAGKNFAPHLVAEYTYQTAQYFNTFYTKCPINSATTENLMRARRLLAQKAGVVIKNGLNLLGIETVDQM